MHVCLKLSRGNNDISAHRVQRDFLLRPVDPHLGEICLVFVEALLEIHPLDAARADAPDLLRSTNCFPPDATVSKNDSFFPLIINITLWHRAAGTD